MLPSLPPIRQGSSERAADVISSPASSTSRTRSESKRNPGGRGNPKLTNSRPRAGALPTSATFSSEERFAKAPGSLVKTALAAKKDPRLLLKNDLLESFEPNMQRNVFSLLDQTNSDF